MEWRSKVGFEQLVVEILKTMRWHYVLRSKVVCSGTSTRESVSPEDMQKLAMWCATVSNPRDLRATAAALLSFAAVLRVSEVIFFMQNHTTTTGPFLLQLSVYFTHLSPLDGGSAMVGSGLDRRDYPSDST